MQTSGKKCKYFNIVLYQVCERVRNECVTVITEKMLTHTNESKRKIFYYMKLKRSLIKTYITHNFLIFSRRLENGNVPKNVVAKCHYKQR